jgi:hypothetical protein
MNRLKRSNKAFVLLMATLVLAIRPSIELAQSGAQQANFARRCSNCWPGWTEMVRPRSGVGPRVENGRAYIFINGSKADPALNQEHLQFGSPTSVVNEANVEFNFNNATFGGRLHFTNGNFLCLTPEQVNAFVTEELFIVTLRDTGDTWYGAFIGDLTLIDPDYRPDPTTAQTYTTIGLLHQRESELEVLAVRAIPQVTRFSLIRSNLWLDESDPAAPALTAMFQLADGRKETVASVIEPHLMTGQAAAGLIYLVGNGSPCTGMTQREVIIRSFASR